MSDKKPTAPSLNATRREMLAALFAAATAGKPPTTVIAAAAKLIPAVPAAIVPMKDPVAATLRFLVLNREDQKGNLGDLQSARFHPKFAPDRESSRGFSSFTRKKERGRIDRMPLSAAPLVEAMDKAHGKHDYNFAGWTYRAKRIMELGLGDDQADWDILYNLARTRLIHEGSDYLANEHSTRRTDYLMQQALPELDWYRQHYDELQALKEEIKADPDGFKDVLHQLRQHIPESFGETGPGSRESAMKLFQQVQEGTLEHPDPDMLKDRMWECWGRLTGRMPDNLPEDAKARLTKLYRRKYYEPFLSPRAEMKRLKTRTQTELDEADITVTRRDEELPLYTHGDYKNPVMTHCVPVYYVTMAKQDEDKEEQLSLYELSKLIRVRFPFEPRITDTVRYGEGTYYYDFKHDHLRFVDPDPKLTKWLDSLERPETRVSAIERLQPPQRMLKNFYR